MKVDCCLDIKTPCFASGKKSDEKTSCAEHNIAENENLASADEILANQNIAFIKKPLQTFDIQTLEDLKLDDVFCDGDEACFPVGGINCNPILILVSSCTAQEARLLEATGNLPDYRISQIKDEAKYRGLSEEETREFLEEEKQNFINRINELKIQANDSIDSLNSTKNPHKVYRVIDKGYTDSSNTYFDKISSLKKDDEVVLDCIPLYVDTSAKEVMTSYAAANNNPILFKINLPAGSKILPFPLGGINQCIMKADSKFKTINNQEYSNLRVIELDYLPD